MRGRATTDRTSAILALVVVALVWGVAFSVVKDTLATVSPTNLVTWRFALAALVLLAVRPRCLVGYARPTLSRDVALGALLAAGFLLHTWGMRSTSVVVSAFLTGSVVVFAPLVARVWLGRRVGGRDTLAITLATGGLAVLTVRGTSVNAGSLLITAAAVLWAVHLVALERWSQPRAAYRSACVQLLVVALLAAGVELVSTGRVAVPAGWSAAVALVALGAAATAGAFLLLTWAQARTDATTSAVVLTLEPIFGAAAALVLGETLSLPVVLAAPAVVAAALVIARPVQRGRRRRPSAVELGHQGLRRHGPVGVPHDGVQLGLVHLQQVHPEPAAVPHVGRTEEAGGLGLDHLRLDPLGSGAPDGQPAV
jgi:drug/metabolite transporter (DMT)-like permease